MTRVLRSEIAEQPAPLSTVASSDGTVWTRYLHRDVDRWYGVHHVHGKRPVMLARTWPELAASGDLTILSEPAPSAEGQRAQVLRSKHVGDMATREAVVLYRIAETDPADPDWHTQDVLAAYRRGVQDGSTRAA